MVVVVVVVVVVEWRMANGARAEDAARAVAVRYNMYDDDDDIRMIT